MPLQGSELTRYFIVRDGEDRMLRGVYWLRLVKFAVGLGDSGSGRG